MRLTIPVISEIRTHMDEAQQDAELEIRWGRDHYFSLARGKDGVIYCEYCEAPNGFYSRSLDFSLQGHILTLSLQGEESFSQSLPVDELRFDLTSKPRSSKRLKSCLKAVFACCAEE